MLGTGHRKVLWGGLSRVGPPVHTGGSSGKARAQGAGSPLDISSKS